MKNAALRFTLCAAVLAAGCVRLNPIYGGPTYHFRELSRDGQLNKVNDGNLDPQGSDAFAQGFRFDLTAPGALLVTAKPSNPQAQLDIDVFGDGNVPLGTTKGQADKKLTVQDLQPGTYYIVVYESWKDGQQSHFKMTPIFKPVDPDAAQQACKTQATARDLPADKGQIEDGVDYSNMRRTCWWRVTLESEGGLNIKFNNNGNNINADFVPAQGAPEKIDPAAGLNKPDLPAGDYFVKVYANDAGDAGRYTLATTFKQGDTCKNEPHCSPETAEDLKLPQDNKPADVDLAKGKQFHFYKASFKEKGKLTIVFKILQPPRGSKVAAYFMKAADDTEGEKISGSSVTKDIETPGDYFIRVQAAEQGDFAKYSLQTLWSPANFIPADVVEIGHNPCMLTVSAGSNQGVRANVGCTIVNPAGQPVDSCVVDQVFPNLSKVKPANPRCSVQPSSKVQISGQ
jgi:hypothetical protein